MLKKDLNCVCGYTDTCCGDSVFVTACKGGEYCILKRMSCSRRAVSLESKENRTNVKGNSTRRTDSGELLKDSQHIRSPTLKIKIQAFPPWLGLRTGECDVEARDVGELLRTWGAYDMMVDKEGSIYHTYRILLNGRDVKFMNGVNTVIKDQDTVTLIAVTAGG